MMMMMMVARITTTADEERDLTVAVKMGMVGGTGEDGVRMRTPTEMTNHLSTCRPRKRRMFRSIKSSTPPPTSRPAPSPTPQRLWAPN